MELAVVKLYSNHKNEIENFLNQFYNKNNSDKDIGQYDSSKLEWEKKYQNPTEIVDIIGTFIENNDKYKINMWISLDYNFFINITDFNADKVIRYIYERYPW